ncbi:flagellar basal body P-ring formation chaperone FlgA [Rheinheimera sp.]|uniref:flagellar basal body P-ring formation chaperone FlgA n=1 Tax=Rheinheimera sp. TaxID=1869214 RepID=UPI002FDE8D9A
MSYHIGLPQQISKTEALLPLWKWLFFLLLALPWQLHASTEQQIRSHISAEVQRFARQLGATGQVQQQIELSLPPALQKKPACNKLMISRSNAQQAPWGRTSYSVECRDQKSWQSRATAKVRVWLPVVVASRQIQRDEVLSADMLSTRLTELEQSKLGVELNPEALLGLQVKRRIAAGQVLSRQHLTAQLLVEKGNHVLITVQSGGFAASTKGVALEDGQLGQRIKVQNLSSGVVIEAEVVAEARVQTIFKSH